MRLDNYLLVQFWSNSTTTTDISIKVSYIAFAIHKIKKYEGLYHNASTRHVDTF